MALSGVARRLAWSMASALVLVTAACGQPRAGETEQRTSTATPTTERAVPDHPRPSSARDLSIDESMGGHTLARHVGKTDAELSERLRRERDISSASTYTDRETAERAVGDAVATAGHRLEAWLDRRGRRPNLVLQYKDPQGTPIGRSLSRGRRESVVCDRALVVLRWDERANRYYVLTSYPEAER
jgi:CDI toxin RNase A-like protein